MTDRAISVSVTNKIEKRFFSTRKISRPSLSQVVAIVDFMEKHPELALGQLRGLEGRHESKRLWFKLTRIVNNISGPTRPMKSWVKFWADKKSTVRSKVLSRGGDTSTLSSHIDKKIYDLFLADDQNLRGPRRTVKVESHYMEEPFFEETMEENHVESEPTLGPALEFGPTVDIEERQMLILEKLVKVMSDQAEAMTQMAHASQANAQAIERLADASTIQARAIERLATTFESMGETTQDVRNAIAGIDATMKRYYTSPT